MTFKRRTHLRKGDIALCGVNTPYAEYVDEDPTCHHCKFRLKRDLMGRFKGSYRLDWTIEQHRKAELRAKEKEKKKFHFKCDTCGCEYRDKRDKREGDQWQRYCKVHRK